MSVTVVCLLANFHLTIEGNGKITLTFAFLRAGGVGVPGLFQWAIGGLRGSFRKVKFT